MGETAPFWRFSAASYPDLQRTRAIGDDSATKQIIKKHTNGNLNGVSGVQILILPHALAFFCIPPVFLF